MRRYIVWEHIKNEGWEPYEFSTLFEANDFMNRKHKDVDMTDCILTKEILIMGDEEL